MTTIRQTRQPVPACVLLSTSMCLVSAATAQPAAYQALMQDVLVEADIWDDEPRILSASFGFDGILGIPGLVPNEPTVRAAGGTWMDLPADIAATAPIRTITTAAPAIALPNFYGVQASFADAMPIVFSWPLLPETVQPTDFELHLSDGSITRPLGVSIFPCHEFNERNVAVVIGEFGNRLPPGTPGAVFLERTVVVNDGTPLTLVGPGGVLRSVVGMSVDSGNPYLPNSGPTLVGAKLSRMSVAGEDAPAGFANFLPNDGITAFGADAQYRLRILTSGGFSPNGVSGIRPDEFSRYFRLHASDGGSTVVLTDTGVDYQLTGGRIQIVGLADLGQPGQALNLAYIEDWDNYIDIVLAGDESAMRQIVAVEIPAAGDYDPFYNPGGPGNDPTPGISYTQPGPPDIEPVIIALDDPMVVSIDRAGRCGPMDVAAPFGTYDFFDVVTALEWIVIADPLGDFNASGSVDFFDLFEFLQEFSAATNCP